MSVESTALFVALLPLATAVLAPLAAPGAARAADATLSANVNTIPDRAFMGCLLNGALHDQSYLFRRDVAIVSEAARARAHESPAAVTSCRKCTNPLCRIASGFRPQSPCNCPGPVCLRPQASAQQPNQRRACRRRGLPLLRRTDAGTSSPECTKPAQVNWPGNAAPYWRSFHCTPRQPGRGLHPRSENPHSYRRQNPGSRRQREHRPRARRKPWPAKTQGLLTARSPQNATTFSLFPP